MERAQKLIGPFLGIFLLSALPALGQELRAVGQIRSTGPITCETSQKIVSRLRGLIAEFHALGIAQKNAAGWFHDKPLPTRSRAAQGNGEMIEVRQIQESLECRHRRKETKDTQMLRLM